MILAFNSVDDTPKHTSWKGSSSFRPRCFDKNAQNALLSEPFASNLTKTLSHPVVHNFYMIIQTLHDSCEFKMILT